VKLKADIGGFIPEMESSAKVTASVNEKVKDVDQSLKKIPADAIKAAAAMKLLGSEGEGAAKKIAAVGRYDSSSMQTLERQLVSARVRVKELANEFNRTGSSGTLTRFFSAQADVKSLERLKKDFTQAFADAGTSGGQGFASNLMSSISGSISGIGTKPALITGLVAAAVAAAPLMGAAINGALGAAAGVGGIGLGIVGQLRDPAVKTAFAGVGHDLMAELAKDTAPFKAPLIAAAHEFGLSLQHDLAGIDFSQLANLLGPLERGLSQMISNINLGKVFSDAAPLVKELARDLPMVGSAIGEMFALMAKGGQGAKEGLRSLLMIVVGLLIGIGQLVRFLSDLYQGMVGLGEAASGAAVHIARFLEPVAPLARLLERAAQAAHDLYHEISHGSDSTEQLGRSLKGLGEQAAIAAPNMQELAGSIGSMTTTSELAAKATAYLFDKTMGLDQATLQWHQSLTSLHDTLKQNGKSLDENTAKGQANVSAIYASVTANMAQYQAFIAAGGSAVDAAAQYDVNTKALEAQLRKAGLTQGAIDGLIGKYRAIPDTVNTQFQMRGLTEAIDRLDTLLRRINGLPYSKEITINVTERLHAIGGAATLGSLLSGLHFATGGIRHAAQGMIVAPSNPGTLIGEPQTGGEALIPLQGISRSAAAGLMHVAGGNYGLDVVARDRHGGMSGWSGGGAASTVINLTVNAGMGTDGHQVAEVVVGALRKAVNARGGNVQYAVTGRNA
jgi:hypothetical protein